MDGPDRGRDFSRPFRVHSLLVLRRIEFGPPLRRREQFKRSEHVGIGIQHRLPRLLYQPHTLKKPVAPLIDDGIGLTLHCVFVEGRRKRLRRFQT